MTQETNPAFEQVKAAFAPFMEAFKNFPAMEVPEATRDFVKRTADTVKGQAAEVQAGAEKFTSVIENAVNTSVSETTQASRRFQQAARDDLEALFAGIDKLAASKSIQEAMQVQADYFRERGEVAMERAKTAADQVNKFVSDSAKTAQEAMSKIYSKT